MNLTQLIDKLTELHQHLETTDAPQDSREISIEINDSGGAFGDYANALIPVFDEDAWGEHIQHVCSEISDLSAQLQDSPIEPAAPTHDSIRAAVEDVLQGSTTEVRAETRALPPTTAAAMLDLLDHFFTNAPEMECGRVWDIITALRGPDAPDHTNTNDPKGYTVQIRRRALPHTCAKHVLAGRAITRPECSTPGPLPHVAQSGHWNVHIMRAQTALEQIGK